MKRQKFVNLKINKTQKKNKLSVYIKKYSDEKNLKDKTNCKIVTKGAVTFKRAEIQPEFKFYHEFNFFKVHEHFKPRWKKEYFNQGWNHKTICSIFICQDLLMKTIV